MDLDTPRLRVRDLVREDLDAVDAVHGPGPETRAERARWLEWTILGYEQQRRLHQPPYAEYGIVVKDTDELVGLVGLVPAMMPFGLLPSFPTHPYNEPEVGLFWAVAAGHRRHGYAAEAAAAVVDFAFTGWKVRRVVATTEHTNTASVGVMRRLGMRVDRNPGTRPFFLQVVGVLDNPHGDPDWPATP